MRAAFVYQNPREELARAVARGEAADTNLWGQNHLGAFGIDSFVHDSVLRRRHRGGGLAHRVTWHARELSLPLELRRADAIVSHLANVLPLAARATRGPAVVLVTYHLLTLYARSGAARRRLIKASLHAADAVVCLAESARLRMIDRYDLDPDRVHTSPMGVDERFWTPQPPAPEGYVVSVGRDLARDYPTFVRALAGLPVRGILIAKPENVRGVELPPNVELRMGVPHDELIRIYAGAAAVVVPVRDEHEPVGTENSGNTAVLEAMATARPLVVTERSYFDDYVEHERTALAVPPGDPAAMRAAIERLLADRALADRLGAAARAEVERRLTTRHFAERLAPVLHGLDVASRR